MNTKKNTTKHLPIEVQNVINKYDLEFGYTHHELRGKDVDQALVAGFEAKNKVDLLGYFFVSKCGRIFGDELSFCKGSKERVEFTWKKMDSLIRKAESAKNNA